MKKQNLHAVLAAFVALSAFAGCRALLDGDDLVLRGAGPGGGNGDGDGDGDGNGDGDGDGGRSSEGSPSAGTESSPSSGPGGAGDPSSSSTSSMTTSSTGGGGSSTTSSSSSTGSGGGSSCADLIEATIGLGAPYTLVDTNDGQPAGGCVQDGPSRFIRMTPQADGFLSVWIRRDQTDFDSALGIAVTTCNDADVCSNATMNGSENIVLHVSENIAVWIAVSGSTPADTGTFGLEATLDRGVCSDPVELHVEAGSTGPVVWFNSFGLNNHIEGSCGGGGDDIAFRVTGVGTDEATATLSPISFDAVLHTRRDCATPELGCGDAGANGISEELDLPLDEPVFLFLDSNLDGGGPGTMTVFGAP